MLGSVIGTAEGMLRVPLDGGELVAFDAATYANVDHGYAATIHKNQGVTVDRAYVLASSTMDRHLAYVALTRHRDAVRSMRPPRVSARRRWPRPCRAMVARHRRSISPMRKCRTISPRAAAFRPLPT